MTSKHNNGSPEPENTSGKKEMENQTPDMKNEQENNSETLTAQEELKEDNLAEMKQDEATSENAPAETVAENEEENVLKKLQEEYVTLNDKFLRLYSDFENHKKRTLKERMELIKTAGAEIFIALLTVLDDFDRAVKSLQDTNEINAVKEGIQLIHSKFKNILQQKGLQEMQATGTVFDTDLHDALTNAPAPSEEMKGKVLEELEKGYFLNGKVIRHAKVVVGN